MQGVNTGESGAPNGEQGMRTQEIHIVSSNAHRQAYVSMQNQRLQKQFEPMTFSNTPFPAEKEGQKRKRKIKLNGVENGMIPRKKTDKKGKKNKVNGVSGFGNLMSRKEAESRNCSAIFICCRRYRLNIP